MRGEKETDRERERQTDRQTDRQVGRQAGRQAGRQTDTERLRDRQTDRQIDRQDREREREKETDRQTDRDTERQRQRNRNLVWSPGVVRCAQCVCVGGSSGLCEVARSRDHRVPPQPTELGCTVSGPAVAGCGVLEGRPGEGGGEEGRSDYPLG